MPTARSVVWSTFLGATLVGLAAASSRAEISLGAEYETREGVIRYKSVRGGVVPTLPEETMNERFLCTTEKSDYAGWPLVSLTHDMAWDNNARTLEIVLGPTKSGDAAKNTKQAEIIQKVYRFMHKVRTTDCLERIPGYCYFTVSEMKRAIPELTDDAIVCGGDYRARYPDGYSDVYSGMIISKSQFTSKPEQVWTQLTIGVTLADFIDVDAAKLFGKSRDPEMAFRRDLFKKIQDAVKRNFAAKPKTHQSAILYAAYAVASFVVNEELIPAGSIGGDGYHAPIWKNAYVLYPKTSVPAIVRSLAEDPLITGASVKLGIELPEVDDQRFRDLWDNPSSLDQAKPARNFTRLLLEVRTPVSRHITIANPGNAETMAVTIPALTY